MKMHALLLSFLMVFFAASHVPAVIDPETTNGYFSTFDETDLSWSPVNTEEAIFEVVANPEGDDNVGKVTTTAATDEGFQCDSAFVPMNFSIRDSFHVAVYAPAEGKIVRLNVFEKDNPDNNYSVDLTTTKANVWDTLSFDFSAAKDGVFNMFSIHPDIGGETVGDVWYFNNVNNIRTAVTYDDGVLLDYDEHPNYTFFWDCDGGMAEYYIVENPLKEGINTSDHVAMFFTSVCQWEGVATAEKFVPFEFTDEPDGAVFSIKVLAPAPDATFMFKIEKFEDNTANPIEVQAQTTTTDWEELTFDFAGAESGFYARIALFPDFLTTMEDVWYFDDARFLGQPTNVDKEPIKVFDYQLKASNYPNPFNPSTTISYSLPKDSHVKLTVFDMQGREIETLVNAKRLKGDYSVTFDGSQYATGLYLYKLETESDVLTKKMLLVK